jgi:hypothetical protein
MLQRSVSMGLAFPKHDINIGPIIPPRREPQQEAFLLLQEF